MSIDAVSVVFLSRLDLDGRILGVDLPFDEVLQMLRGTDIETDLPSHTGDLKREVLLDAGGSVELLLVAEDTVQGSEELLGGELFLVVVSRDF
ncbi:hypothetical protein EUA62_01265 [TM7 phylum sp. oral taxon 348]|nr:hypothetical protein EUA62_01265 [TM7 phylum sp. oral taxon 348]